MVSIYFCGIQDSLETKLSVEIWKKIPNILKKDLKCIDAVPYVQSIRSHQNDVRLFDDSAFYQLHENILQQQSELEEKFADMSIISDHCIIDNIAQTRFRLGQTALDRIKNENEILCRRSIQRYQSSITILLSPKQKDLKGRDEELLQSYLKVLNDFQIPFINLCFVTDIQDIAKTIKDALNGCTCLPTSNLQYYRSKEKMEARHFSFFKKKPMKSKPCICIRTIKITEHEAHQHWTIEPSTLTNRFIASEDDAENKLVLLNFHDNVRSTVVQKMLLNGITVNGEQYSYLGCSPSGLKLRQCYMWKGTSDDVDKVIHRHGNFDEKLASKRLMRIALLFSGLRLTNIRIMAEEIEELEDKYVNSRQNAKCFTDGCGGISKNLARELFRAVNNPNIDEDYLPSVFQIRLQGYKGVLALDDTLSNTRYSIRVRPSMKKFNTTHHPELGVCGYSKPHTFGHLNKQFILLLSGLGIPDEVFVERQHQHFKMVKNMGKDAEDTITILQWQSMFDVAHNLYKSTEYTQELLRPVRSVQQKLVQKAERLSIIIPESRNIYGICDPTGTLKYGQCFLRVTIGKHPKTITGQVVVIKNPCYLLGDVRVLEAVSIDSNSSAKQLNDFVDCIVFPVKGPRPHPDEIAGSDLDGDIFFVSWDDSLVPKIMKPPYDYASASSRPRSDVTSESMIQYFAKQNETVKLVAKINKYFMTWADRKGINSEECYRLGILFSRIIDAGKTGEKITISPSLKPEIDNESVEQKFVWQKMLTSAHQFKQEFQEYVIREDNFMTADVIEEEFVLDILKQVFSNITEFEKFQFVWSYLAKTVVDSEDRVGVFLESYADFINFALFLNHEKQEAWTLGIPIKVIENALHKSRILSHDDLASFNMHTMGSPWKFYFRSDHGEFDWSYLLKALTENDRVFFVLKVPDQITIALQFLTKTTQGLEQQINPGTISGYLYSKRFGYRKKYILGSNYFLDLTENTLQLYLELKKNLTFVWLKASDVGDSKKNTKTLSDELLNQMSVNLLQFNKRIFQDPNNLHPLINKIPFVLMEVFVQAKNTDVPYFDTIEANYLEPVMETEEFENDESEDYFIVDVSEFMSDSSLDEGIGNEAMITALADAAEQAKPLTFKQILCSMKKNRVVFPDLSAELFFKLLVAMVKILCRHPVPKLVNSTIDKITNLLISAGCLQDSYQLLRIIGLLCNLNLDHTVNSIAHLKTNPIKTLNFLNLIEQWELWWYMDKTVALTIMNEIKFAENDSDCRLTKYVQFYAQIQFCDLLGEFEKVKERFKFEKTDFSVTNLQMERKGDQEKERVILYRVNTLAHNPRIIQGKFVAITRQRDYKKCHSYKSTCCIARVEDIVYAPVTITVRIINIIPDVVEYTLQSKRKELWRIDLLANSTTHMRVMNALHALEKLSRHEAPQNLILDCLIHPGGLSLNCRLYRNIPFDVQNSMHVFQNVETAQVKSSQLNQMQREAVAQSLMRNVTLIQGAPGTGKTFVACEIIKTAQKSEKFQKILVVAETNVSVDNILKQVRKDLPLGLLRIGNEGWIDSDVYDLSLTGQLKRMEEIDAKKTMHEDDKGRLHRKKQFVRKVIDGANVVLTTCAGSGDSVLDGYAFDFVIVDDATQAKETTLLCSLVNGAKHLTMIGDLQQPGPMVGDVSHPHSFSNLPNINSLSITLFHRLCRVMPSFQLDTQYRMHPALMKYPSENLYENKLKSQASNLGRIVFPWPDADRPFCFIDINSERERKVGSSYCNDKEADTVKMVLDKLLNVGEDLCDQRLNITDIGILTLYQGQVKNITETTKHQVECRTLSGFQGREKEVIIISTVRVGSFGFLDDKYKLNVLLTRARRGLIVIGNEATLRKSSVWSSWLSQTPRLLLKDLQEPVKMENRRGADVSPRGASNSSWRRTSESDLRGDTSSQMVTNSSQRGSSNFSRKGRGNQSQNERSNSSRGRHAGNSADRSSTPHGHGRPNSQN